MNNQKGFTLIELVIVIVILGILAVTAAPKFINLQGDAKGGTLQAVKASVESATAVVHAKALIQNKEGATGAAATVTVNGGTVNVVYSWPTAEVATWTSVLDIAATDFSSIVGTGTEAPVTGAGEIYFYPVNASLADLAAVKASNCYVVYTESDDKLVKPAVSATVTGC